VQLYMDGESVEKNRGKLESVTRRWWFILLFILLQFVPAYASKGYDPSKMGEIIGYILGHSMVSSVGFLYPVFKVIPILLVLSIVFFGSRATRWFSVYVGVSYVLFAFLQSIAITEKYGLSIVTSNLVMFLIVAVFWFWEAVVQRNDFALQKLSMWKYWVVPFAFMAFWYPANPLTLMPDFNPVYLLTNGAGLAFCMMTPVYLAILTFYYPRVNVAAFRVTSIAGTIIGFYNVLVDFFMVPSVLWWNGVLHIPLITISIYGLILSFRKG